MKSKFFTLFAAFALLFGAKAMAQTNGDVNEDGKVDEQDITAIIQIMQEAGGVKEPTKYYWYAGWTIPTAENIATIVNEANGKAGAYIGTKLGTYDKSNYLAMIDYFDVDKYDYYYVVVPEGIKLYDSEGDALLEDQYSTTSINIPNHRVLISIEQQFSIGAIMLR